MDTHPEKLLHPTEAWRKAYPRASAGILALADVDNETRHPGLADKQAALAANLKEKFAEMGRPALRDLPTLKAYADYYKAFKKTYHVQLQLESVVFKGKPFPQVSPLVDAMFMTELTTMLLTAGHDLSSVHLPVRLDIAGGHEQYTRLQGNIETLKPGDMYMADRDGVISSILYGPDRRTRIRSKTRQVLYTVYAPAGVEPEAVLDHLTALRDLVASYSPGYRLIELGVYSSSQPTSRTA